MIYLSPVFASRMSSLREHRHPIPAGPQGPAALLRPSRGHAQFDRPDAGVGLTADDQRKCAGRPPRNVYAFIRADGSWPLPRPFPRAHPFAQRLGDGLTSTLNPADCSLRQAENHAVLTESTSSSEAQALQSSTDLAENYGLDVQLVPLRPLVIVAKSTSLPMIA